MAASPLLAVMLLMTVMLIIIYLEKGSKFIHDTIYVPCYDEGGG